MKTETKTKTNVPIKTSLKAGAYGGESVHLPVSVVLGGVPMEELAKPMW